MSTPNPFPTETEEQVQGAELNGAWNPWQGPAKPGFWSGAGFSEDNPLGPLESMAIKPLGQATAAGELLLAGAAHRVNAFAAQELGGVPLVGAFLKDQERRSELLEQDAAERVKALTPDPQTAGTAVQTVSNLVSGGYRAAVGTILGGPIGGAALLGSTQGAMRYKELREQGVDEKTAAESAGLTGVTTGAGALIPGGFGASLFSKIATGAAANVGLGVLSRYGDSKILEAAGYKDMAAQERVWDGVGMVTDALLGGAFGGLAHLHAAAEAGRSKDGQPSELDQAGARDAALATNLAMRDRAASPGVPVDPASASTHAEALRTAVTQIASNQPVNVADVEGLGAAFVPRPEPETGDATELFMNALKEGGVFEEQRNLEALERAFNARLTGEEPEAQPPPVQAPARGAPASRFLDEFEGAHPANPEEPTERLVNGNVRVEMARDPFDENTLHINSIRALKAREGAGTKAMEHLAELADRHQVRLTLDAQPLEREGVSSEKLVAWYERFGFRPIGRSGERTVMARTPQSGEGIRTFTTAKGSTYQVTERGTTIRNKAPRPEHPGDFGPQPESERTFYVTPKDAEKLGEFQTQGGPKKAIRMVDENRAGVHYLEGQSSGKFERRTVVNVKHVPEAGLTPVELWDDGRRVHFGNEITEVGPESVTSEAGTGGQAYTVGEEELTDEQRQAFERLAHPQGEVLPGALGGGRAAEGGGPRNAGEGRTVGGARAPTRVYRGAALELRPEHFEPEALGVATGHPSSGLGVFFTNDAADAARYGPVTQHDLTLQNPKRIPVDELPGFDTVEEARAFRDRLRAEGHDGIIIDSSHLGGPKHYAVFEPGSVAAAPRAADPLAGAAVQAVQERPGLEIAGEDGQPIRAAEALGEAQQAVTDAERDAPKATTAAVNCFMRKGGG